MHRGLAVLSATAISLCTIAPASAATLYWRSTGSDRWELATNWSTIPRGTGDGTVPTASDVAVLSFSGSTAHIRSNASVGGIILSNVFTGSLLMGTGTLSIGTTGFRVGSGSFVGGTGRISNAGDFTQTGGTVRGIQGTMTTSGSYALTDGSAVGTPTFSSTGTLVFDGATTKNYTRGANTTIRLQNVTLENSNQAGSHSFIVNSSGGLNLSGSLTVTTGKFDLSTKNVDLVTRGGITIANSTSGSLVSDGNITVSGSVVTGANGTFTMSGNTTLTLNGVSQNLDTNGVLVYNMTVGSSSGTYLTSDQRVSNTLQVNTGSTLTFSTFTFGATGATILNYGTIRQNTGKLVHTATNLFVGTGAYIEANYIDLPTTVTFSITDSDGNITGTAADTLTVVVTTTEGESETVTLTETNYTSGVFRGSISGVAATKTAADGTLQAAGGTDLTVTYTDAQDGLTNTDTTFLHPVGGNTGGSSNTGGGGGGRRSGGGGGGGGQSAKPAKPAVPGVKPATPAVPAYKGGLIKQKREARLAKMMENRNKRLEKRKAKHMGL